MHESGGNLSDYPFLLFVATFLGHMAEMGLDHGNRPKASDDRLFSGINHHYRGFRQTPTVLEVIGLSLELGCAKPMRDNTV